MPDISSNPHGGSILTIIIFGLVVGPVSFALRLWARWVSAVAFWWDDLLMGLALVRFRKCSSRCIQCLPGAQVGALGVVVDNIVGRQ